jgi:uncharacterized protein (UPF0333 family)
MENKQSNGPSGVLMAFIGFVCLVLLLAGVAVVSYISASNNGNRMEKQIIAEYDNNKNILASYSQKIAEAAQVPDMMRDDLQKVVVGAIQARYGADGSKATMQWLQEQNPSLDPQIYRKLQQIIEAGRDEFKTSQTRLIDVKRNYETNLDFFWSGMWMRLAGYPKINLADYKVVTTDKVEAAFKSGREEAPIKLRPAQ